MTDIDESDDERVIQLLREIVNLRQNIYLHRMIGLNVEAIEASHLSNAFFGHIQFQALQSIALGICKIYEPQNRYDLNSIPGAIADLPEKLARPDGEELVNKFASSVGAAVTADPRKTLVDAVETFLDNNKGDFDQFKTYRDKVAAHSEAGIKINRLPSHDSFDLFFEFARDSYAVMRRAYFDVEPALIHRKVAIGLKKLLEDNGVTRVAIGDS